MGLDTYAVIDVETTGLDREWDSIIELGWMLVEGGQEAEVKSHLVNPGDATVSSEITAINGITQQMVDEARPIREVLEEFVLDTEGMYLVGHNVLSFDAKFLQAAVRRHHRRPEPAFPQDRFIDTAALYKGWRMGMEPLEGETHTSYASRVLSARVRGLRYNLQTCCQELGVSSRGGKFHRTAGDIVATHGVLQKLLERGVAISGEG